jgi:hypothetical protein
MGSGARDFGVFHETEHNRGKLSGSLVGCGLWQAQSASALQLVGGGRSSEVLNIGERSVARARAGLT